MITEDEAEFIRKSNQELMEKLEDFKLHPENYKEATYRSRSDNHSEIAVIQENEYIVTGVIVRSKSKAEIGLCNTFHKSELVPFIRLKCNHISHKNEKN